VWPTVWLSLFSLPLQPGPIFFPPGNFEIMMFYICLPFSTGGFPFSCFSPFFFCGTPDIYPFDSIAGLLELILSFCALTFFKCLLVISPVLGAFAS